MIKNVNLMQNPDDIIFDKDSLYSKEHIIQALANLGQRIGIKGDGISYKSFTFNDILLDNKLYSPDDYIGYIEYAFEESKLAASFGVALKENIYENRKIDSTFDINNALNFNSELAFSIPVCGIEKYSKNSLCINNDKELTFMLVCKKIGYNDNDDNNSILVYYKFDINTNRLICCYKLFHIYRVDENNNYYCLLSVNNTNNIQNYTLDINIINSNTLVIKDEDGNVVNKDYKEKFENLFNFNNYASSANIEYSIINKNYEDVNNLLKYNSMSLDMNSAIAVILNMPENLYHSKHVILNFDIDKNELLSSDTQTQDFFYNEYYKLNINEELFNINEEINKLYFNIFNYYNEKFYLEKRSTLVKRILMKVYERATANIDAIPNGTTNNYRLYVPLDYEFHYICNSNNELNIYYSNNIYVTYTSLKNINLLKFWDSNNNLVFDYEGLNKLKVYNFEINYNSYAEDLINSITIKDIYTMPYINANNNWSINDSDTKIKAIGKDAGNPNVIVIYNNDKANLTSSYKILSIISNKEDILKSEFDQKWFSVHTALFKNTYNANIKCCSYIPEISVDNYEYFKDSIILSISDLNCLEFEKYKDKYQGSYILTLWHLENSEEDDLPQFNYINHTDTNFALALGSAVNISNELSDTSIVNLNSQDLILLKSIITNVAHERLNVNQNNWLIVKNKQSEEYTSEKNSYNNDLNMILQYDDNISVDTDHIVHSHSANRYISNINNVSSTNSIYPKYEYYKKEYEVKTEKIPIIINTLKQSSTVESKITVDGKTITNVESLIERLKNKLEQHMIGVEYVKETQVSTLQKLNSNYYEYVFNDNVPTLDCKEIFARNFNLLNRLNLISIDDNGKLYNAYIGTSYNESDKSTLHIGSSNLNINLGTDTLINELDKNKFNKHKTLSLDFDNIKLNANSKVEISKNLYHSDSINNVIFNTYNNINLLGSISNVELSIVDETNNIRQSNINTLFVKDINGNNATYISVNNLMTTLNVNIASYNNVIITTNLINSNSDNYTYYNYTLNNNEQITTLFYLVKYNNFYTDAYLSDKNILYGKNTVDVMYYEYYKVIDDLEELTLNIYLSFR